MVEICNIQIVAIVYEFILNFEFELYEYGHLYSFCVAFKMVQFTLIKLVICVMNK